MVAISMKVEALTVDLVVKNGRLVSPRGVVEGGVAIDGGVIVALAKTPNLPEADEFLHYEYRGGWSL